MKRKLALLMAFMMTAAMVPASHVDAATRNALNKTVSATSSSIVDDTSGVILSMTKDNGTVSIKGAKHDDYFELHLDGEARWTYNPHDYTAITGGKAYYKWVAADNMLYPDKNMADADKVDHGNGTHEIPGLKGARVKRLTDTILGVYVDKNVSGSGTPLTTDTEGHLDEVKIPLMVFFNGQPNGPQVVKIVPKDSEVSAGEYTFANVESDAIKFRVQKKEKISRSGNTKVQLIFDEVTPSAFDGREIQLKLPKGFAWDISKTGSNKMEESGLAVSVTGKAKTLYDESDGRIITVTPTGTPKLDSAYLNIAILPDRDARFGDVDVIVQNNSDVAPSSLVVAEYVDYGVTVKADKVINAIAGKDIEGLYRSKLTIEEPATSSLQGLRYMTFEFVDEKGNEVKASLQDQEILKLTKKAGDAQTKLFIDPKSIDDYGNKTGKTLTHTVKTTEDKKDNKRADKFDLFVEKQSEKVRAKFELEVPFVVGSGYEGKLFLKVKGAGAEEQLVQIADVKPPVKFEPQGALPQVKIGLQRQKGTDLLITETEAAALQDYEPAGSKNYAQYELEFEPNFRITFDDAKVEVKEGNISLNRTKPYGIGDGDKNIYVRVDKRSTKPSKMLVSNVLVTLDRTVPYGPIRLEGHYGVVKGRHNLSNVVKTFDYFTTVTPVSDEKRITSVFAIDDKEYYEVNGKVKEKKTMDVAPFIKDDRTMLPVRYIAEAIGAEVNYDPKTRIATFQKYQSVVTLNIDKDVMYVNGSPVKLFTKPANVENRIFLPLVNIAQAFGLKQDGQTQGNIIWNKDKRTVTILPQDATAEEYKEAKDGTVLDNAEFVTAAPAGENKEEEKKDETGTPAK
ncbi:copper amine oxidase N-terminal domain protein [Peptostreptococcaceae bacterium AS15]|nr:copper amine oxidase N-terminal domain protein [Peptostreptococcaceae bacterium AS15]